MAKYLSIIAGVLFSLNSLSQTGSIKGSITTIEGQGAQFVKLYIKGINVGTLTDKEGKFILENITSGSHTLVASSFGLKTVEKQVEVKAGETTELYFSMEDNTLELQSVEIIGRKENDYKSDFSFAGTKMEMKSVDIPQSISTVTKEVIKDQQAYRLNDVAKLAAGVNQFSTYDDITMRGFRNSEYRLINGMRMTPNFWSSPLLVNIERVEFLKGPSSALFGNSNPGGTINMVTKKPLKEQQSAIDFATGSFGTLRTTADFTGPLNEKGNLLYR